ncbi:MAG: hypothetical protein M1838_003727 [Thelocarpon superellum]|nr:MAG: hypothetical protein M1838_003727 [Thelocarpon superellum]
MIRLRPSEITLTLGDVEHVCRRVALRRAQGAMRAALAAVAAEDAVGDEPGDVATIRPPRDQARGEHPDIFEDDGLISRGPVPVHSRSYWDSILASVAAIPDANDGTENDADPLGIDSSHEESGRETDEPSPLLESDNGIALNEENVTVVGRSMQISEARPSSSPDSLDGHDTFVTVPADQADHGTHQATEPHHGVTPYFAEHNLDRRAHLPTRTRHLLTVALQQWRRGFTLPRSPLTTSQDAGLSSPLNEDSDPESGQEIIARAITPRRGAQYPRRYRERSSSDLLTFSQDSEPAPLEQTSSYRGLLHDSVVEEPSSSPPRPHDVHDRSTITEYSPHQTNVSYVSSPQLPSPIPRNTRADSVPSYDFLPQASTDYPSSPARVSPPDELSRTDMGEGLYTYRTRSPLFHLSSSPPSPSVDDDETPQHYSPTPSPPAPLTPHRSMRVYDDRLSPTSQPQTPSRRQTRPFDPSFTAPAGSVREYVSLDARRRWMRRRDIRSGSPIQWDRGDWSENLSAIVEASRWEERIRRHMRNRQVSIEGEGVIEGSYLDRTPERETRVHD